MLILPKEHFDNIYELDDDTAGHVFKVAKKIATAMNKTLDMDGLNVVQNNGEAAGQTVFHFHMHIIPRHNDDTVNVGWEKHICSEGTCIFTKEAVSAAELYEVYAILKGCRMKALHTEKYENAQLETLNATISKAGNSFDSLDNDYITALVMAYGESLRNREYQDYGRDNGGVLWN